MNENIIILHNPQADKYEAWGSLTELCEQHSFSYHYLKRLKFPFTYKGISFRKSIAPTVNAKYIVVMELGGNELLCLSSSVNPVDAFGVPFDICGIKVYSVPFRALNGC